MNPLGPDEVVWLDSGHEIQIWMGRPRFPGPGEYRVVAYYHNYPDTGCSGVILAAHCPKTLWQIRRTTPCRLRSNEVVVSVLD